MKKIFHFLLFNLIPSFGLLIIGCSSNKQASDDQRTVFRYNASAGITSLDPAFARNLENIWPVNQLFNGLVQLDDELQVKPSIAHSWQISADGLTYTFYLRDDVYFHDHELFRNQKGRKVTASDFVFSFNRIMDEKTASPGLWIFNTINRIKAHPFEALSDTVFQIHLTSSFPPFLGLLTMQYCSVVPKEVALHYGNDFRTNPVGTGPFKFKMWKEGVKLVLVKNENYFERDEMGVHLPYLDAVTVSFLSDQHTAFLEFLSGNLDFLSGLNDFPVDEALTREGELQEKYKGKFRLEKMDYLKTDYLGFLIDPTSMLSKESPLRKRAVRLAINYAINRREILTYMRNSIGKPAKSGFVPPSMPFFSKEDIKGYYYDPERAKDLLFEAGYPEGKGLGEITLTTAPDHRNFCEAIQAQLNNVGIKVNVEVNPPVTQMELVAKGATMFFWKSWVADYSDAENFLALFYSKNISPAGPNYTCFKNLVYDHLYEKARLETNDYLRNKYYHQMDQIIIDEAPVVPLFYDEIVHFVQNDITGFGANPMNLLTLKKVNKIM